MIVMEYFNIRHRSYVTIALVLLASVAVVTACGGSADGVVVDSGLGDTPAMAVPVLGTAEPLAPIDPLPVRQVALMHWSVSGRPGVWLSISPGMPTALLKLY